MIGLLRGMLAACGPDRLVLDCGGVGYEVVVTPRTLADLPTRGSEVTLHVHTQVREDAITLYGFGSEADRQAFRVLMTVTGIGPKLALAIVGTTEPEALARAIAAEDVRGLSRIPGLGNKTAARICLELKDKLGKLVAQPRLVAGGPPVVAAGETEATRDATEALAALGYNAREIARALATAAPRSDDTVQTLLRRALQALSP